MTVKTTSIKMLVHEIMKMILQDQSMSCICWFRALGRAESWRWVEIEREEVEPKAGTQVICVVFGVFAWTDGQLWIEYTTYEWLLSQ